MKNFVKKNKFLVVSLIALVIISIVDINYTYRSLENTWSSLLSMLIIVPPIFVLIGLFDVWVPRETIISLMGKESGIKGMALAFLLGAFSAGPILAAFPLAMVMLKKGASYNNVMFFLMVWSSLKLPIVFFQISMLGLQFSLIINAVMLTVFIASALIINKFFNNEEIQSFEEKAHKLS